MATKVTILGEQPIEQEKKKIEFVKWINENGVAIGSIGNKPSTWGEILLLQRKYQGGKYDLMFASKPNEGSLNCLYLGHFNDGIV